MTTSQLSEFSRPPSTRLRVFASCLAVSAWVGLAASACAHAADTQSKYTSIAESDCKPVSSTTNADFEARGLTAQECPGVGRWQVLAVSSDERSWLEIARDHKLWSTEREVVYENSFGNFPNVGAGKVEWRLAGAEPYALIFRVTAQNPALEGEQGSATISRLFVVRLEDGSSLKFCGVAAENQAARALADDPTKCKVALQERTLP